MSKNFYDNDFVPLREILTAREAAIELENPAKIYEFLRSRIYKQDQYCKALASILYNHANDRPGCYFICGPSGCGKSAGVNALRELWPNTIVVDSASLSSSGWSGDAKVRDFTKLIDPEEPRAIVCFDEFDKLVDAHTNSAGENTSEMLQHEFLKLIDGCVTGGKYNADCSKITFLFCGSFAKKANAIAKHEGGSAFGFNANAKTCHAYDRDLTVKDLIDFGLIVELASRCEGVTTLKPLTLEDYKHLLKHHESSPLKKLEKKHGIRLSISDAKLDEIARTAYESELGVRNCYAQIKRLIDDEVFESFVRGEGKPNEISL